MWKYKICKRHYDYDKVAVSSFNLKDIHREDFWKEKRKSIWNSKIKIFFISFKNKDSPDKSLPYFPCHHFICVRRGERKETNKQSGIELLTAKVSGSKSYFFKKRESKNNFWNSIPTSYLLQNHQNLKGREKETTQNNFEHPLLRSSLTQHFKGQCEKLLILRLGNSSSLVGAAQGLLQGYWAALGVNFAKCIFRHFGAACWDIFTDYFGFFRLHKSNFHFSDYKSQKRPNWRLIQTFFFSSKGVLTKKPWHKWFFYIRYLSNIYWKHIAPSGLKHNETNPILEFHESEFKPLRNSIHLPLLSLKTVEGKWLREYIMWLFCSWG